MVDTADRTASSTSRGFIWRYPGTAHPGPHSDLEVHLPPSIPEAYGHSSLEAYQKEPAVYSGSGSERFDPPKLQDTPRRRIDRLSKRAFWALVAIAIVLILAAALGGGLGGGLSQRTGAASAAQTQTSTSTIPNSALFTTSSLNSDTTTTTTTSSDQISLTEITNPTSTGSPSTLIRDCPSSDNTIYSAQFGSTIFEFRKICSQTIAGTGTGNTVNTPTISLNECIQLCAAWNANSGNPPCQAVCWRNVFIGSDHPGVCFGYQTTNTSRGFSIEPDAPICDSAAWIN